MSKRLKIYDNGVEYTLEFTRRTAQQIENRGFNVQELDSKVVTNIPLLIHGAFMANHPRMRMEQALDIWKRTKDHEGLMGKLTEMYADTITSLLDEPEESEKNATWAADW